MKFSPTRRAGPSLAISWTILPCLWLAGCHASPEPQTAADAAVAQHDAGSEVDAAADAGERASDGGTFDDADVAPAGGDTLWIGNSLVRHGASGPYPAYDVPAVVQDLHAARGRGAALDMRVLAQDGFDLFGWWTTWYG